MRVFWFTLLGVTLCVPFLGCSGVCIYKGVTFDQECEGYLENAAHASTVQQALPEMEHALAYIESHGMTTGYTSIFYKTQGDNVGYWYGNLKAATDELRQESKSDKLTALEQSNVLLKLDNTIKSTGTKGESSIKVPSGISVFPHNMAFAFFGVASLLVACIGVIIIAVQIKEPMGWY